MGTPLCKYNNIHVQQRYSVATKVKLGYGASLGGVVLLELLKYADIQFEHAFFEGTSFYTNAKLLNHVFKSVLLKAHKKALANPTFSVKMMGSIFGEDMAQLQVNNFIAMNEESIKNIIHDCASVELPTLSESMQNKCVFAYGSKDLDYRKAKRILPETYPHAQIRVWKGYGHCQKMIEDTNHYCKELEKYIHE